MFIIDTTKAELAITSTNHQRHLAGTLVIACLRPKTRISMPSGGRAVIIAATAPSARRTSRNIKWNSFPTLNGKGYHSYLPAKLVAYYHMLCVRYIIPDKVLCFDTLS